MTVDRGTEFARTGDAGSIRCKPRPDDPIEVVRRLRAKLEDDRRSRARRAGWSRRFIATGLTPLDAALPYGGLPCGVVTEVLFDGPGVGAMSLAMRIAGRCATGCHEQVGRVSPAATQRTSDEAGETRPTELRMQTEQHGQTSLTMPPGQPKTTWPNKFGHATRPSMPSSRHIVLVDTFGDFYPPAVCRYGIALDRLIVVRPKSEKDAFWAIDQSLRCSAVAAVVASLRHLDERLSRRLQLAAESSGCIGLILRPDHRRTKSFAAVRMLVESVPDAKWADPSGVGAASRANRDAGESSGWSAQRTLLDLPMGAGDQTTRPRLWRDRATPSMFPDGGVDDRYPCRITVLKVREGMPVEPLLVDLHDETGTLCVHPVPVDRSVAKLA